MYLKRPYNLSPRACECRGEKLVKANAMPELNAKWWSKNKAKTMKKSGLGKALKNFEVAEDMMDYDRMLKALSEVKKKLVVALKACNPRIHADTIAGIKKYPAIIQKRETGVKAKKKEAKARAAIPVVPKQKVGKSIVIWKKDIGREVLKEYKPAWVKDLKGYELSLTLNNDLLDILEKEGDYVTPQQMVDDANDHTKRIVNKLVVEIIKIEDAAGAINTPAKLKKALGYFHKQAKNIIAKEEKLFKRIPDERWKKFVKRRTQYKFYKVKTGFNITLGTLGVVGGTIGVVGGAVGTVASSGAALGIGISSMVLGVTTTLRGVAALTSQVLDLSKHAEKVEKALAKDLNTLTKRYQNAQGQAKKSRQVVTEMGGSVLKSILSTDPPFLATLPKCDKNFGLWQNKVGGLAVGARKLSKAISKGIVQCDKLEKSLKKVSDKKARKLLDKLRKARKTLDKALNNCSDLMGRVTQADKNAPKLKKVLDGLNGKSPKYVAIFDKYLPIFVNLTLTISGAGLGFAGAGVAAGAAKSVTDTVQVVLDSVNTGLGLVNDVGSEVKDLLQDEAEKSLA